MLKPLRYLVIYSHLDRPDEVRSRHRVRERAEKACAKLQQEFDQWNRPSQGVKYLCGYSVIDREESI